MRQTSDTALFRKAFFEAGFRQATKEVPTVYSDLRKSGIRRIKLYDGDHVFAAPQFAQEDLEWCLKDRFGDRYLGGEFIPGSSMWGPEKAFVIYLLAE